MDRRRAAGLLLALAASIATATAAPTASNHTALDLYDGAPDGCYYNFQHYGEGDRIMTNEPCLNCTCHNRMLMCYLRVCPFTKPIGQDCTIEKRADQCCPIVTCPDVPVDLLTSTTTSPAEYGPTGVGKLDKFGCSLNGKYFSEGSKVPPTPNKPCEHCYCIRNMTTCVMQECTLHVDGCTPIYHKDVCCPVRYSCDHPEDEMPLLDDLSTTVRPTPGFLLTTTTISPVTQISQDCVYDNRVFPDGALIKTEKACDHCYCMKGDIVCVVQECGTPMENEGKNCTALPPRDGVCCPDTYICEGDEPSTQSYETNDFTTHAAHDELTTLSPPRRTISEGSGYRNEPDEVPYTKLPILPEIEGSGEEEEPKQPIEILSGSSTVGTAEDILGSTEETHEYIPLTTTKPFQKEISTTVRDENVVGSIDTEKASESQQNLPTTTDAYNIKKDETPITDRNQEEDIGSGEAPEDIGDKPHEGATAMPELIENIATTEINKQNIVTSSVTERESSGSEMPVTSIPTVEDIRTDAPIEQDTITGDIMEKSTPKLPSEHAFTNAPISEDSTNKFEVTEQSYVTKDSTTKGSETNTLETTSMPIIKNELKETTESAEQKVVTVLDGNQETSEDNLEPQHHPQSTIVPGLEDEFVTTESPGHEIGTEDTKEPGYFEPQQHVTASTPMLEELEKDTTEYTEPERIVPSIATQDSSSHILSTTISNIYSLENDEKDVSKSTISEEHITDDYIIGTTSIPVYDQQEIISEDPHKIYDVQTNIKDSSDSSMSSTPNVEESGKKTTQPDFTITNSQDDSSINTLSSSTTASELDIEGVTTEPDKDLNTIPSDAIEEAPVSPEAHKSTLPEEIITTETNLDLLTTTSKQTTIAYTSISREEPSALTTESAFRKDDYSPTGSYHKLTTVTAGITNEVMPTVTLEQSESTELEPQKITITTTEPIYTEKIEETTLVNESTGSSSYAESSTSKVSEPVEESMTNAPTHETLPVTTTFNQEDNEILNEPRIPGEGDCLLNGETYRNESSVPSSNKCQSGCKCVSSIIKCDPIICSPAPEYMNNCETMFDSPDACCPTYICDHKTETIPPQSHSQMAGTETPVILTKPCHGNECEIKDKKHSEESSETCKSGSCAGSSDESKITGGYPLIENIPHQPVTDKKEECVGDSCKPIICTIENGCQATPVRPCEGNKCETTPNTIISQEPQQQCADGENCPNTNISSEDCSLGNCDVTHVKAEDTHPKETCTDKDGCQFISNTSEIECTEENCKEKESHPLDQHVPEQCLEPGCKKMETDTETDQSESITKDQPVKVTESTEKPETNTEPFKQTQGGQTSEFHEMETKYPEIISDGSLTTLSDKNDEITQFESQTETSTKSSEFVSQHEVTSSEYVPEKTNQETAEEQDQLLPVTTESTIKENENKITSSDEIFTEVPNVFMTTQDDINYATEKEHPQIVTEVTTILETNNQEETSTKISGESQTQKSESVQNLEAENTTPTISEEYFSEPPKTDIPEYQKVTLEAEYDKTTIKIVDESGTEPPRIEEGTIVPGIVEHATITPVQESITEPAITYVTESQEDITKKIVEESITIPPKSLDDIEHDNISAITITEEKTEKIDKVESVSKPSIASGSTLGDMNQDVTTMKITETVGSEPTETTTVEIQDVSQQPKEKYTPSIATEEPATDSSTAYITEFFETTVSSITKLPQEINEKDFTGKDIEESGTVPTKTSSTETKVVTESSKKTEHEGITIKVSEEPSTESAQTYVTEPKSPEQVYHDDTTAKTIDDSSTEPPKMFPADEHESTKSPQDIDQELTTDISQDYYTGPPSVSEFTEEIVGQTDTTSKIFEESSTELPKTYSPEPEVIKSSDENVSKHTTVNILEEFITEPSKTVEQKPQEVPKSPVDQEDIIHSVTTDLSESYVTEAEEIQSSHTTIKAEYDITTKPSKSTEEIQNEVDFKQTEQYTTQSDIKIGTTEPTLVEISTEEPEIDEKKPSMELEISQVTTSSPDLYTSEPTHTLEEEKHVETTIDTSYDITSLPPNADIDDITDSPVNNQITTLSIPTKQEDHDFSISVISVTSRPESGETTLRQEESQKPSIENQTVLSSVGVLEVSQPETTSTQLPEKTTATEKVSDQIYTEIQSSPYTPADDLRTTSPEMQDLTTSKPVEISQAPHDMEIVTEHSETSHTIKEEYHTEKLTTLMQEVSTEEISLGTEKPVETQEEIKTEKLETVTEGMPFETEISQTSSDNEPSMHEGSYTEESVSKYSSPESTVEFDSTKSYPNENISTTESIFHESEEPVKTEHDLTQSLVTEKSEISTNPSDSDSQTQKPIQVPTKMPESDISQASEQDNTKAEQTTPTSKSSDTTISKSDDQTESVTSTDFTKPIIVEEVRTELPQYVDKIENEVTTHKESFPEDVILSETTVPEPNEIVTSTTLEHKLTTEHFGMTPLFELTTEAIAPITFISETQESMGTNEPSPDVHNLQTEASYTTTPSETKVTKEQDQPLSVSDHTESELEVTDKVTDIHIHEQTEPPKTRPEESSIASSGTESPTFEPVKDQDQVTMEFPETSSKEQPELNTFKPSVQNEFSSVFEPTTTAKYQYPESTSSPLEEFTYKTPIGEQFTTENIRMTENSDLLSPDIHSETQPETLQTITPEKEAPVKDYHMTRKPSEPEVYKTTISTIEILPEQSTNVPIKSEEESTTSSHDVLPAAEQTLPVEEQSIPVVISNTEKISSLEESVSEQTSTSEKPSQETSTSEEFILDTQKPTVVEVEEEISSESPISHRPAEPTDLRTETPVTTVSKTDITRTPETFVTITPEGSDIEASATPITIEHEASVTPVSEAHFTAATEASVTIESKVPDKSLSEAHTTAESEVTTTITSEAPTTKAPEVPITAASDTPVTMASEIPIAVESEAPVMEASEAPVTAASVVTVTREAEASITTASEQPITPESEAPVTPAIEASEAPITTAPELPKPVSTEAQPIDDVPAPDEEASFPPSAGVSGYGPEPSDYGEEDQNFGPGTCRYGGKVYVSAQQIPRDDPCDFCFCFRSDIICLQQSCPPPIHGCHEEPIQGFCCPRYECPVSMATTVNVTTTTTTTTTTLPPHFPTHSYKGSAQKRGCQIKGQTYKVGDIVRASSGPCLHCTCGGDGQMKCDPKVCTPEPMLRQMIAAAVSAKRRR